MMFREPQPIIRPIRDGDPCDYQIFDQLPKPVRDTLNATSVQLSSLKIPVLQKVIYLTEPELIDEIRRADRYWVRYFKHQQRK